MFDDLMFEIKKKYHKEESHIIYNPDKELKPISSGSIILDLYSKGGLALSGGLVEFNGLESSGKTTVAMQHCREAINNGGSAVYFDIERTFSETYANNIGLFSSDKFLVLRPRDAEEFDSILQMMSSKNIKPTIIVVDSVAAVHSRLVLETPIGDSSAQAEHARVWSKLAVRLKMFASLNNTAVVLINQLRGKPQIDRNARFSMTNSGVGFGFSNTDTSVTTTGGYALRYYLDARYLFTFSSHNKEDILDNVTGEDEMSVTANNLTVRAIKSKVDNPYRQAKFMIRFGKGTDDSIHLLEIAKNKGLIKQTGSWFEYITTQGESIRGNGKVAFLSEFAKPEIMDDLIMQIKKDAGLLDDVFNVDDQDGGVNEIVKALEQDAKPSATMETDI